MPALSTALSERLDSSGSPDEATYAIVNSPALLDEARALLPDLERVATAKAGEDGVRLVVGRRLHTYPQPDRSESEWSYWWADYFDAVADLPLASLEAGMRAYVSRPTSQFMPKPGELRDLAITSPSRSLQRYYRAKRAIQIADTPVPISGPPVDPEEVKALLNQFNAQAEARKVPEVPARYTGGIPDEGGITAEMRALIARRAEEAAGR